MKVSKIPNARMEVCVVSTFPPIPSWVFCQQWSRTMVFNVDLHLGGPLYQVGTSWSLSDISKSRELMHNGTYQLVALEPNTEDAKLCQRSVLFVLHRQRSRSLPTPACYKERSPPVQNESVICQSNNVQHSSHDLVIFGYTPTNGYPTWDGSRRCLLHATIVCSLSRTSTRFVTMVAMRRRQSPTTPDVEQTHTIQSILDDVCRDDRLPSDIF